MPSSAASILRWGPLGLVMLMACGGAAPESAAPTTVTPTVGPAGPPPTDEARFASDVSTPPPPKPERQIDRDGDAPPPPAERKSRREVDKTVAANQSTGGGQPTTSSNAVATDAPHDTQMLIYTAHVTMSVYQVAPALDAIEGIARSMGGYLESRNDTQIQIRIPRARFDEALHKVEASGDVLHRDVTAQDVTDAYFDLEARLKNARAVRDRLQALLEKAAVKEALDIQKELERVTGEVEVLEGKVKLLSSRISYSTIDVTFQPRASAAVQLAPRLPFSWLGELGLPKLMNLESR